MKKNYIISTIFVLIILGFYYFSLTETEYKSANYIYKVYLEGKDIGYISDKEELYSLINEEQKEIKEQYNVDSVYPPNDFEIIKVNTYNNDIKEVNEIYSMIETNDNFTIKGYEITVKSKDEEGLEKEEIVYVLEKEIFEDTINYFVDAYINAKEYEEYINGEQQEIEDTGKIITNMYFAENISIQEAFISVNEKIYTNESDLLQFLIFGEDAELRKYTVKVGDTISSIADDNELNISEFLISNPSFRNENNMLKVDEVVNVTLQNPIINFIYEIKEIAEQEIDYTSSTVYDNNYGSSYKEVTTPGITGIDKVAMTYQVTNGIVSQEVEIVERETIRDVVNQVTTLGVSYSSGGSSSTSTSTINTGLNFTSPVNKGFIVTSPFGEWRSSYRHEGTDFSGTGYNSPIYAISNGVVTQASNACSGCSLWALGTYIVIDHGNNYHSVYMHLVTGSIKVSVGQTVSMGQQIAGMGSTGRSTGTHLHLGFAVGEPMKDSKVTYYDPYALIFG